MKKVRDGYKMTELGEIPSEWEVKNIGEVAKFQGGYAFKSSDYVEDGIRLVKITNVQQKNISWNEEDLLPVKYLEKFNEYKLQEDDVVIAMTRPIISTGIKVCKIEKRDLPCLLNQRVGRFIIKDSLISKYLYNYCFTDYFINKVKELCSTTGQPNISANQIESILITIPSVKEQEKIASILSTVDEQIDNVDALIEKNKELKKGLMQTLLTKGIGHTKFKKTEIGEIPDEWNVIKFFDFVDKIIDFRGRTPKKLGMDWGNGDIQALSANNVKMGKIDFSLECYLASEELYEKWMSGNELKNGDIIMTMEAPLGNVALVPDERKYILSQRVIALKTKDFINNKFMKYMLMSDEVQRQLETLSTGTTAKGINQKNLARVYVKIPMIKEQEKIASILFKIDEKIEEYENKKQKLEVIKKGLMQKLLTGEIRGI